MKRRNKRQQRQRQQRQRVRQASELPLSQLLSEELISKLASADKNVSKALRFALNDKTTNGFGTCKDTLAGVCNSLLKAAKSN